MLHSIYRRSKLIDLFRRQLTMDQPAPKRFKSHASTFTVIKSTADVELSDQADDKIQGTITSVIQRCLSDTGGPWNGVRAEETAVLYKSATFQGFGIADIKKSTVTRPRMAPSGQTSSESSIDQSGTGTDAGQSSAAAGNLDGNPMISGDVTLAQQLIDLEVEQTADLRRLSFGPPIATVYRPIEYAFEPHCDYVRRYCRSPKTVIFVGMNPGPFGMVQSGVPFGECRIVKDWLQISGNVRKPSDENAKRPIIGLECGRNEVSGTRFWGFIRSLAVNDDPNSFFEHCYVHNYCPAAFLDAKGKNITPPSLRKAELSLLEAVCDDYLLKAVKLLRARIVVGIGAYAYDRCRRVLLEKAGGEGNGIRVEMIMHPSPANPATNTGGGWPVKVREQLEKIDVIRYMSSAV